jgi:hypothetical protein
MSAENNEILEVLHKIERHLAKLAGGNGAARSGGGLVADTSDLDSQYGDPEVRKDPTRWIADGGKSFVGLRFSQCTPEYLDALASLKDWMADKDEQKGTEEGTKYARYGRLDASRARGWAERLRNGWAPKTRAAAAPAPYGKSGHGASAKHTAPKDPFDDDDSLPF